MDLTGMKEERDKFNRSVEDIVRKFELSTGLTVYDIRLGRASPDSGTETTVQSGVFLPS